MLSLLFRYQQSSMMSLETVVNWKISVKMLKSVCVNVRMSVWLCVKSNKTKLISINGVTKS